MSEAQSTLFDVNTEELSWEQQEPDGACVRYDVCGNVPAGNNMMCAECLDDVRHDQ